jgi:hypothetical protein
MPGGMMTEMALRRGAGLGRIRLAKAGTEQSCSPQERALRKRLPTAAHPEHSLPHRLYASTARTVGTANRGRLGQGTSDQAVNLLEGRFGFS